MVLTMNINLILTWILFIGLFFLSFFWLKRAYVIIAKKDYSYVALKWGKSPADAKKYAPYYFVTNLAAGLVFVIVIFFIVFYGLKYEKWTAVIGTTFWMKIFVEFILSRHAHLQK
jgi:hypothetical protein